MNRLVINASMMLSWLLPDEANPEMAALRATLPDFDSTPALSINLRRRVP